MILWKSAPATKKNINGSVLVTTNADEFIALFKNNVVNDISLTNKKSNGFISLQDENNNYLRTMSGSVTLDMDGSFLRGKPIWAKKDINITSQSGMIFVMNLSGETNNETLKAMKNVTLKAALAIAIGGKISAGNDLAAHSDKGAINVVGSVQANNDVELTTQDGDIMIGNNPEDYALIANGNVKIKTDNGTVTISGKVAATDGDIIITSNQDTYAAGQKGITVEKTGAINPGKNLYLNTTNGDITADTLRAAETLRIALERGELYLDLAQSKGVAILTGDTSNSTVNTIKANSVDVNDAVAVGKILPYRSAVTSSNGSATNTGSSGGSRNGFSNAYGYSGNYSSGYSNFASNPSSFATFGSTFTPSIATYWQSADSAIVPSYDFGGFRSLADNMSYRLTRNYFEVKFIPTWLEKEFLSIDFDSSFDNFGIKNTTEDDLLID